MDTSEPSTALELTPYEKTSRCAICAKPAHGFHHGALTCRACCAFFRRSAEFRKRWKCKKDSKCDTSEIQYFCKKCRLEKCFKKGMTAENFQFYRDSHYHLKLNPIPTGLEQFVGRPHVIIRCEPKFSEVKTTFIDLSSLIEKGLQILSQNCPLRSTVGTNSLQKLANHMNEIKTSKIHGFFRSNQKVGKESCRAFWEFDFCRTAEWLSHFDEFQELPNSLKMEFLKTIWYLRTILERIALDSQIIITNSFFNLNLTPPKKEKKLEFDLAWCTVYKPDQIQYFTDMSPDRPYLKDIADIIVELKSTDVEVNFMILQICFHYAGRRHQGEILRVSEKLLENVSIQMHDYYSKVMKMPNYAGRLARLMKCDRLMQEYMMSRKQKVEIAQIFDIFDLQFSHPEMFDFNMF